jgi:transposase InsO family protein
VAHKRRLVGQVAADQDVRLLCRLCDLRPSAYSYAARQRDETALRAAIEQIALEYPRYGTRRMTAELRRRQWQINRKHVQRVMRADGLLVQIRRLVRTSLYYPGWGHWPNLLREMRIERPNQVWAGDITYVRVQEAFVFVAVLLDLYTRSVRGWHVAATLEETLTRTALERALLEHGAPEVHHSDHGMQYLSQGYRGRLEEVGTRLSLSSVGKPTENAFCERLMRTLKEEEVYLTEYVDLKDARERIGRFLEEVYMHKRVHSSLGYQTPSEFEAAWWKEQKRSRGKAGERQVEEPKKTKPPKNQRRQGGSS